MVVRNNTGVKPAQAAHLDTAASAPALALLAGQFLQEVGRLDVQPRKSVAILEDVSPLETTTGTALVNRLVKAANSLYWLYEAENNLA